MKWLQRKAKVKPNRNDSVIEQVAKIRGINTKDIDRFLNPTKDELYDPHLLKNVDKASKRIVDAIRDNEKIVVSYDSDVDGISSGTIMVRYLKKYTNNVDIIYHERSDGHGISSQITLDFNKERNPERAELNKNNFKKVKEADLLIIVDSSSNDVKACQYIQNELNTDVVILDHHVIEEINPHCILVNPQQEDCEYPNKHLSGAGVVFKTIQVAEEMMGDNEDVWQYIDLVAVGIYADVMRIDVLENRYLIIQGLRNMKNAGLLRILKSAKEDLFKLNGDTIGFTIAPLINGVTRMNNIKLAIDLLLEDDDEVCKKIHRQMKKLNEDRKSKQKEIVDNYSSDIDIDKKVLIITDNHSGKGFNGLVAQQLAEKYKRPVIVGRVHQGFFGGSCRSYGSFKMKSFLSDLDYVKAAGHEYAFGVVIPENKLDDLISYIEENMPQLEEKEPTIIYDLEIDADEAIEYIKPIEQFNLLTGNGFPKIVAKVNGITVEDKKVLGKTQETVKITTFNDVELIKFRVDESYASELECFDEIDVIGVLKFNEYYNFGLKQRVVTPQIMIEDYKVS